MRNRSLLTRFSMIANQKQSICQAYLLNDVIFLPTRLNMRNFSKMIVMIKTSIILFQFFLSAACLAQKNATKDVFVASTPCSEHTSPLPGMKLDGGCELMLWSLTFFHDETKQTPANFKLECAYGMSQQGTPGLKGGGTKLTIEGNWTILKEAQQGMGSIIELTDGKTKKTFSFLKLNDNLLHLLDADKHLMIGTAAWSYTLSRIKQ